MKSFFITAFLLGFSIAMSSAQESLPGHWNAGWIILKNGQKLSGELRVHYQKQEVQLHANPLSRIFKYAQIESFAYVDEQLDYFRHFKNFSSALKKSQLLEIVLRGSYQLLKEIKANPPDFARTYYSTFYTYYCYDGKKIFRVKNFRRQFKSIFEAHQYPYKKIVAQEKWDYCSVLDQIKLLRRLNMYLAHSELELDLPKSELGE